MIFYHRTTEKRWEAIQDEGVLWGKHGSNYRYTYLAPFDVGESFGTVLLAVDYEPKVQDFGKKHNYGFNPPDGLICDQFSVFEPILLKKVRRIGVAEVQLTPQLYS